MNTYGYHRNTTPTIDSIAKQGTVFSEAYSNGPGTRLAIKSLCAGVYPLQIEGVGLPESEMTTLAEHLSQHGYKTGCFSSNGFIPRGFGEVSDVQSLNKDTEKKKQLMIKIQEIAKYIGSSVSNNRIYDTLDKLYNQFLNQLERYEAEPLVTNDEVVQSAIDWIDSNEENEKTLFAWIHLINAHAPYQFKPDVLPDRGASPEDIDVV
jgi:arylsulfatase